MMQLEMEVRPGAESGRADVADDVSARDRLAEQDRRRAVEVPVEALEAVGVRDLDVEAQAAAVGAADEGDGAVGDHADR